MVNEAKIILEAVVVALDAPNPDIEAMRKMIAARSLGGVKRNKGTKKGRSRVSLCSTRATLARR